MPLIIDWSAARKAAVEGESPCVDESAGIFMPGMASCEGALA
jgi:hypothetical protein